MGMLDAVLVAISHNISFVGKTWWLLMVGLRLIVVLLAGFTLFSDEQERFVCDTIQPGCSNVCFDLSAPVSLFRLWLLHVVLLSLPHLVSSFVVIIIIIIIIIFLGRTPPPQCVRPVPSFHHAYLLVVTVHILMEAAFVAGHVLSFGLFIPRSFLCYEAPCASGVRCYVSRPTEKTLMLGLMLGLACLSVALSLVDLVAGARRALRRRRRRRGETSVSEEMGKGEQSSASSTVDLLSNKRRANGFESGIQATPSSSTDSVPDVAAAAALKDGADCEAGKLTDEKGLPWQHGGNGKIGFSTNPKAMPLHFVVHNQQKPPELASLDGRLAPRLENFTPADTRKRGQLASMESTSTSRQNSTPSEGPDKRAWV
ncbi:unnamed protein product [Boreogadus saida]